MSENASDAAGIKKFQFDTKPVNHGATVIALKPEHLLSPSAMEQLMDLLKTKARKGRVILDISECNFHDDHHRNNPLGLALIACASAVRKANALYPGDLIVACASESIGYIANKTRLTSVFVLKDTLEEAIQACAPKTAYRAG